MHPREARKGHFSQFCKLFLVVWLFFNQYILQIKTFVFYVKTLLVKHKIPSGNFCKANIWWPYIKNCF